MSADRPHFSAGPFCGSCPESSGLHTGCLAARTAKLAPNDPGRLRRLGKLPKNDGVTVAVLTKSRVIYRNPGDPVEPFEIYMGVVTGYNGVKVKLEEEPEV